MSCKTCCVETYDNGLDEGMDGEWYSYAPPRMFLSCGHETIDMSAEYCPQCGAKIVDSEEVLKKQGAGIDG